MKPPLAVGCRGGPFGQAATSWRAGPAVAPMMTTAAGITDASALFLLERLGRAPAGPAAAK
jgi:hypothetical protein